MEQDTADPNFTFAFQPIVDVNARKVISYEALIRGPGNESAYQILKQVPAERLINFDQRARVAAIILAARLGIDCNLNLNFIPQSLYSSTTSISSTLEAADRSHLAIERIVLEVTEGEIIADQGRFDELINEYRGLGLTVAIDDFGAGYSGLNLLANFQPDQITGVSGSSSKRPYTMTLVHFSQFTTSSASTQTNGLARIQLIFCPTVENV